MENVIAPQPQIQPTVPDKQVQSPNIFPYMPIIILIAMLSFATSGYLVWRNQQLMNRLSQNTQSLNNLTVSTIPTAIPTDTGATVNFTAYAITPDPALRYMSYSVKVPSSWHRIEHSSNFQDTEIFQDTVPNFTSYVLKVHQEPNLNSNTKKPYATLREATGLAYDVMQLSVDGQSAARVLPRTGSESDFKVVFFSKDAKDLFSIELDTPRDGTKVIEGEGLFNQIISQFRFTDKSSVNIKPTEVALASGNATKIIYQLPAGWQTTEDKGGEFPNRL
jgi:hypothetical protein